MSSHPHHTQHSTSCRTLWKMESVAQNTVVAVSMRDNTGGRSLCSAPELSYTDSWLTSNGLDHTVRCMLYMVQLTALGTIILCE
jgi:hypothetical protein